MMKGAPNRSRSSPGSWASISSRCASSARTSIILAVVEADDIDSIRNFALQSRLMQWNTVKIHATYSMEEALPLIDSVEPIF
jgi:hypothetical protein